MNFASNSLVLEVLSFGYGFTVSGPFPLTEACTFLYVKHIYLNLKTVLLQLPYMKLAFLLQFISR